MSSGTGPTSPRTERLNTKAAGIIGLAVMCSRVLGLVREQVCAALFGGGGAMDAFTAAFRIPNLLRDLFAEGALSTAFVTTFSKTIARSDDAAAWRLANKVATLTLVVLGSICVAGMVFSSQLVGLLAPGFGPEKAALTAQLTRIMFPFILMVSMAALVMGMLNAKSVFGIPAMASSFFNIGSIVGGVTLGAWIDPDFGPRALIGLAIGTLIGGALQFAVQLPPLAGLGFKYTPDFRWRDPGVNSILRLKGPSVIAASTTQFNVLVNSMFASTLGDGAIFWLAIAFRLMQLPLGLFGVALGTVTLPLLSRLVVAGHMIGFRAELARAMRLMFLLTVPSTIGLMMLAEPIISVLYQHGRFDAHQAAQAGGALRFYAIGLAGYAALKEFPGRRTQSAVQLGFYVPPARGPSWACVLHRMRGDHQFCGALRTDVSAARRPRNAAHGRSSGKNGNRRGGSGGRVRGFHPLAAVRLADANVPAQDRRLVRNHDRRWFGVLRSGGGAADRRTR